MGLLISLLRIGCTSKSFIFSSISAYTISFPLILCDHISRTTYLSTITFSPWKSSISTLPYTFTPHSLPCCFLPQQPSSRSPKQLTSFRNYQMGIPFLLQHALGLDPILDLISRLCCFHFCCWFCWFWTGKAKEGIAVLVRYRVVSKVIWLGMYESGP